MNATDKMRAAMMKGFRGPRPGSNAFSYLALRLPECEFPGEHIEAWLRDGLMVAEPTSGEIMTMTGGHAGPYGDIPDVDMTHNYFLTPQGREVLQTGRFEDALHHIPRR